MTVFRTFISFAVVLTISMNAIAQKCDAYDDGTRYEYRHDILAISVSPMALLDAYNGSAWKAGLSIHPTEDYRITVDAGGYWPQFTSILTPFDNMRGYHFRGTLGIGGSKYDYEEYSSCGGFEYAYRKQHFDFTGLDTNAASFTFDVSSYAHFFGVYTGQILFLTERLNLEIRSSVGLRFREISNAQNDLLGDSDGIIEKQRYKQLESSRTYRPYFHLGLRLSYVLWHAN